jgi:hypothetical protein
MPTAEGEFLAKNGFKEIAKIKDTNNASYAYRGGDPTKINENALAGNFPEYKPTKLVVSSEQTALTRAHSSALSASVLLPSVDAIGPSPSSEGLRSMNPAARLQHIQNLIDKTKTEYMAQVKRVSAIDAKAQEAGFIPVTAPKMSDWIQSANPTEIDRFIETQKILSDQFPGTTIEPGGKVYIDPKESRIQMLATQRSGYAKLAFDYGPLSNIQRFYDALLTPINSKLILKNFKQTMWNQLAALGAKTPQIEKWTSAIRQDIEKWRATGGPSAFLGNRWVRSVHALPEQSLRDAGIAAFGPEVHAEILAKYGNYQSMLAESGNRLIRAALEVQQAGGKVNPLMAAADAAYRLYQYQTGPLSGYTRVISKLFYPVLRFSTDPFWILFNATESDLLGLGLEGLKGTRLAQLQIPLSQERRAQQLATSTVIPSGGLPRYAPEGITPAGNIQREMSMWDYGFYTQSAAIQPIMDRVFAIRRINSTEEFFRALKTDDPMVQILREHVGDVPHDWAAEADKIAYGWTHEGPTKLVANEFKKFMEENGYTKAEFDQMVPAMESLASLHRKVYTDLTNVLVGRMDRSNLERVLDHIFVFWPMSYQIKASTWLFKTLLSRYGVVGAYTYTQMRNKVVNDQGIQDWLTNNNAAAFMLDMLFPITPESVGVSTSRPVRYVGSWFNPTVWGTYQNNEPFNPLNVAQKTLNNLGLFRTLNYTSQIWSKNMKGWVQDQMGNWVDPSQIQTPATPTNVGPQWLK